MRTDGTYAKLGKPEPMSTQVRPEIRKLLSDMSEHFEVSMAQLIEDSVLAFAGSFYFEPPQDVAFSFAGDEIIWALEEITDD